VRGHLFKQLDKLTVLIILLSLSAIILNVLFWALPPPGRPPAAVPVDADKAKPREVTTPSLEKADDKDSNEAVTVLRAVLGEFHVNAGLIRDQGEQFSASVPMDLHFIAFYNELSSRLDDVDGEVRTIKEERAKNRITFDLVVDDKLARHVTFIRRSGLKATSGKAAIIIDDFGYTYNDLVKEFLLFQVPLTISIIPGLDESKRVARDANLAGREILVHMPMEPENEKFADDGYTILSGQDAATIRLRVRSAFALLPNAIGMNNHQGSKVTCDRGLMKEVMKEVKRQNKVFIDSRTSPQSVALETAHSLHVRAAANQIFIDAEDDKDFIRSQMNKLADQATREGHVIGIAHMRKRTLQVLQDMIPDLQVRGVEFVYVSTLL
jgi:polysaccharide deacetylase 2 family uncharacterized protein YibQ